MTNWPCVEVDGVTYVKTKCICGADEDVIVATEAWRSYQGGALAQVAFPELSASERERIISGTCPPCWLAMFPPEEE